MYNKSESLPHKIEVQQTTLEHHTSRETSTKILKISRPSK